MLAKKVKVRSERTKRALANLTVCGFGIYMIHYFFTGPSVVVMRYLNVPLGLQIPIGICYSVWHIVVACMAYLSLHGQEGKMVGRLTAVLLFPLLVTLKQLDACIVITAISIATVRILSRIDRIS